MALARLGTDSLQHDLDQAAYALGHEKDDEEQCQPIKEVPKLGERGDEFRQGRQDRRADERAENAPATADDDAHEEEETDLKHEGVRRDIALEGGEKSTRAPGGCAAEHERRELEVIDGYTDRAGS